MKENAPQVSAVAGTESRTAPPSVFSATAWLIVALVLVKATYVTLSSFWTSWAQPWDYVSWLYVQWAATAGYADALFALSAGGLAAVALRLVGDRPIWQRRIHRTFITFAALSIAYAVISREVFAFYSAPLTYQLLALGGELTKLWSSLEPYVTAPALCALFGLPAAYLAIAQARWRPQILRGFAARVMLCTMLLVWLVLGRQLLGTNWFQYQDR